MRAGHNAWRTTGACVTGMSSAEQREREAAAEQREGAGPEVLDDAGRAVRAASPAAIITAPRADERQRRPREHAAREGEPRQRAQQHVEAGRPRRKDSFRDRTPPCHPPASAGRNVPRRSRRDRSPEASYHRIEARRTEARHGHEVEQHPVADEDDDRAPTISGLKRKRRRAPSMRAVRSMNTPASM